MISTAALPQSAGRRLQQSAGRRLGPHRIGAVVASAILVVFLALAISIDVPRTSRGFKGDEATYYSLAHSLARDRDFSFQRRDLLRVWEEYSAPEGIFLKRGSNVHGMTLTWTFPFVRLVQSPDESRVRLYYGKSYIYPLFVAPFVALFGTSGFLVFHALLLALNFGAAYRFLVARGRVWTGGCLCRRVSFCVRRSHLLRGIAPELFNFSPSCSRSFS